MWFFAEFSKDEEENLVPEVHIAPEMLKEIFYQEGPYLRYLSTTDSYCVQNSSRRIAGITR